MVSQWFPGDVQLRERMMVIFEGCDSRLGDMGRLGWYCRSGSCLQAV